MNTSNGFPFFVICRLMSPPLQFVNLRWEDLKASLNRSRSPKTAKPCRPRQWTASGTSVPLLAPRSVPRSQSQLPLLCLITPKLFPCCRSVTQPATFLTYDSLSLPQAVQLPPNTLQCLASCFAVVCIMRPLRKHLGADLYAVRWNSVEDKNVAAFGCVIYSRMSSQRASIVFIADENQRECVHVEKVRQSSLFGVRFVF